MRHLNVLYLCALTVGCGQLDVQADPESRRDEAPAYIATMTHLEGDWEYPEDEGGELRFSRDVNKIRTGMALFEEQGALMTVESEIPFANKAIEMNHSIFDELMDAGMGVGSHCDIKTRLDEPTEVMAEEFTRRKAPMDQLIGAENNLGCSGGASKSDWASAAGLAGFKYINGMVGFHYLSMDIEDRPSDQWTDDYIFNGHSHDPAPQDLAHRIHPFMMANADDFEPDSPGLILANAGELGALRGFAERSQGKSCSTNCSLTQEDIDLAIEALRDGLALRDPQRVLKMDVYLPLTEFTDENAPLVTEFIRRVNEEFVQTGQLEWATQRQVYDGYVAWNQ